MAATYMLLLPATAWALSGSVTPVAPVTPVTPAVASTATRVGSIVARIQNALDEACATEAASAGAAPAPLAVGALATACGRRELAARLRAKHYAVLRLPGFDGGRLRSAAGALLDDDAALLRVGGAAPVAPDRPAEFVGVFGGDGPGRFAEGRYGGDGRAAGPRAEAGPRSTSRGACSARWARSSHAPCSPTRRRAWPTTSPPGLEVFDPSLDAWVRPEAAEGAEATDVLCMPGEFLELASAGAFRAVVHRVLGGPTKRVSTPLLVRGDRRFALGGVNAHDCWRALQEREPDRAAEAIRGAPAHVDGASYVAPHRTRAEAETFYSLARRRRGGPQRGPSSSCSRASRPTRTAPPCSRRRRGPRGSTTPRRPATSRSAPRPSPSCPAHAERWRVAAYGPGDEPRADAAGGRFATLALYLDDGAGGATAFRTWA
ncbi:oxidoreductase [Aureococcus anophagefferens]|nr:oxidoreductase [Aureococcus anophagefferens]